MQISTRSHIVIDIVEESTFVGHPYQLETLLKLLDPVLVQGVESIASVHLQFSLGHLLSLLDLHGVQLDLVTITTACIVIASCSALLSLILLVLLIGLLGL